MVGLKGLTGLEINSVNSLNNTDDEIGRDHLSHRRLHEDTQ